MTMPQQLPAPLIADTRFWDKIARKYAGSKIRDADGYERTLSRTADFLEPGHDVLELGCGTGSTAPRLAPLTASYLATDLSANMIKIAAEKLAAGPSPNLTFETATAEDLLQRPARYDAILGFNYLHLVGNVENTLASIAGLLIAKTPCVKDMNPLVRLVIPIMRFIGKAPRVSIFSAAELERAVAAAGFRTEVNERHASKGKDVRPFMVARRIG